MESKPEPKWDWVGVLITLGAVALVLFVCLLVLLVVLTPLIIAGLVAFVFIKIAWLALL